ncbi:Hypothetical predicted protein [Octopus vulgaris]|uniref:HMG box domain-containing protein n=1 Tax=Octopus vulgaris TaxID=6645 RepID=A0AA36BTY5_OCTVU|nr:Hypothetical predicted protein [Octopus vulgaris]
MALKLITACSAFRSSTRLTFSCFSRPLARLSQDSNIDVPKPPKRPMSAFFEFASKNRPAILENNPGIDSQQVIRKVSEIYKNLPDSEKQSERKHGRPRRPMNSYAIFVQASKVERGNLPFVDFSKQLANTWKNLPKEEKEIYNEEARLEREKYAIQMMNWEKLMLEEGRLDLIRGYRRPSKKVKKVTKAKKKKKVVVKAKKVKVRKNYFRLDVRLSVVVIG